MSSETQKRFLVFYMIPAAVVDDWSATDPVVREKAESKLRGEWSQWAAAHAEVILSSDAGGKTKRVSGAGIADTRNDIVVCSVVTAASHEAATRLFENHPHLQIPQSSIEIMELRSMSGM